MTDKNFKDTINDALRQEKPLEFQKAVKDRLGSEFSSKVTTLFREDDSSKDPEAAIITDVESNAKNLGGSNVTYNEGALTVSVGNKQAALQLIDYLEENNDIDSYSVETEVGDNEDTGPVDLDEISDDSTLQFEFTIYIKPEVVNAAPGETEEDLEEEVSEEDQKTLAEDFQGAERYLLEAKKTVVFRGGKKIIKMTCPPGFEWNNDSKKCEKMTSQQIRTRHIASIKGSKKRRTKMAQITRNREKSLTKRTAAGF